MLSDRPYRAALSLDDARAEIRRGAGVQFDPALARLFLDRCRTSGAVLTDSEPAGTPGDAAPGEALPGEVRRRRSVARRGAARRNAAGRSAAQRTGARRQTRRRRLTLARARASDLRRFIAKYPSALPSVGKPARAAR